MKAILALVLLGFSMNAFADYIDVIEVKLNEGCTLTEYVKIKDDFNSQWGSKNGYSSEILMPIQSQNLVSFYWVGRTASAAAFGNAWDVWRNGQSDPNSVPAKLSARFAACSTNVSRRGYDVY